VSLNDPASVAAEYASEQGLLDRRAAYRYAEGPDAPALAVEAVLEGRPRRVLEVGCGPGEAAAAIQAAGVEVQAIDSSERMVELARVLQADGRLVAVTNRREHLQELARLVDDWPESSFDDVNGPPLLRRHFGKMEERDVGGWIDFPDRDAVVAYVDASRQLFSGALRLGAEVPLRVRRAPVIYVATR
jgi:SAM-dependent methyltransferase